MRRFRVEWLLLLAVVCVASFSLLQQSAVNDEIRWGETRNRSSNGALALYRWLELMGYPTSRLTRSGGLPEPEGTVLWRMQVGVPWEDIAPSDLPSLRGWVEAGGTVISFDRELQQLTGTSSQPTWSSGRQRPMIPWNEWPIVFSKQSGLSIPLPPDAVPLVGIEGSVSAFYIAYGKGGVWYLQDEYMFYNEYLELEENRAFLLSLVARLPANARMVFDERKAGGIPMDASAGSLARAIRQQPWGWGVYYGAFVLGLWMLLNGRAFGRPIRPRSTFQRREAGEFARSMGWLYQRTGQQEAALRHLHSRLRRRLIRRYRLNPTVDDAALADAVARLRHGTDAAALAAHLRALQPRRPSDRELVALARASDEWLERLEA